MIEFVRNYTDRSTDRGYQFEFRCDHCSNGYLSSYQPSLIGTAGGLLQAAGSLFGGLLGNVGNSSYEIQRAIGGPAHDRALQEAVAEVKAKFQRCQRCGNWVCAEVCWNAPAAQCTACTPKYEQEVISLRTQAQVYATRQQMMDKAAATDYVSGIDMRPDAEVRLSPGAASPQLPAAQSSAPALSPWQSGSMLSHPQASYQPVPQTQPPAGPTPAAPSAAVPAAACTACGEPLNGRKFCAGCGSPAPSSLPKQCAACGRVSPPTARFCEDCGGRLTA